MYNFTYFTDGPFVLPIFQPNQEDVYSLGVYWPGGEVPFVEIEAPINVLLDNFKSKDYACGKFLAGLFNEFLKVGDNVVVSCVPHNNVDRQFLDSSLSNFLDKICKDGRRINGKELLQRTESVSDDETDLDSLYSSIELATEDLTGKVVILFDMFFYSGKNTSLNVCRDKLKFAGATVYTVVFASIYDRVFPVSKQFCKCLYNLIDMSLAVMDEYSDEYWDYKVDQNRKAMKGEGNPCGGGTCRIFSCDLLDERFQKIDCGKRNFVNLTKEIKEILELSLSAISYSYGSPDFSQAFDYACALDKALTMTQRLFLGEHDFTFASAFTMKHSGILSQSAIATEYMARDTIEAINIAKQTLLTNRLRELERKGVKIYFGLDARTVDTDRRVPKRVPYIHFNFPHDGQDYRKRTLPRLLLIAFDAFSKIQEVGDTIRMALACPDEKKEFYLSYIYNIWEVSARAQYVIFNKRPFDNVRYPGYEHAMTTRAGSAAVAKENYEYEFKKTNLTYEQILAHKDYKPGGQYKIYGGFFYFPQSVSTDNDSATQASLEEIEEEFGGAKKRFGYNSTL
jgi:hypothetical protein